MSATTATSCRITQVLGPVIDVECPPGGLPEVFTALTVVPQLRAVRTERGRR